MSELHGETFRTLGFEPLPVDIKQFTEQIGGDTFHAQDNPLTNIVNFGVHRHHRYITLSGHFWGASCFVCNAEQYRGWPEDVRSAVDAAAKEATAYQRQLAAAEDAEMMKQFDSAENEITTLTEAERGAFRKAVQPVVDRHRGQYGAGLLEALGA
jgi:TRAP-type C4-dicarboxylate transport system substrate-binding protein